MKKRIVGRLLFLLLLAIIPVALLLIKNGIEFDAAQAQPTTEIKLHGSCHDANTKLISIPQIPQEIGLPWCWAASAQNVMNSPLGGMNTVQCQLVGATIGQNSCCDSRMKYSNCNETGFAEWILNDNGFAFKPVLAAARDYPPENNALSWIDATKEICQGRPFISWVGNPDSHQVVVIGYSILNGPELIVFEPALATGAVGNMAYEDFISQTDDWWHYNDSSHIRK